MPFFIDNIAYSDEFNSGTRTSINEFDINANLSDDITFLIDVSYANKINANLLDGGQISAFNSSSIVGYFTSGLQSFVFNDVLRSNFIDQLNELGQIVGSSFDTFGFTDISLNDSWTIKEIISNYQGFVIICNEAFVNSEVSDVARFEVTEPITNCNFNYKLNGNNSSSFVPYINIGNSNDVPNVTGVGLDASDIVTEIDLSYTNVGAYKTGSFSVVGLGFSDNVQRFRLKHVIIAAPITLNFAPKPEDYSQFQSSVFNKNAEFNRGTDVYAINGYFGNEPSGGIIFPFELNKRPYIRLGGGSEAQQLPNGSNSRYSVKNVVITRVSDGEVSALPLINEKYRVSFSVENTVDAPFVNSLSKAKIGVEFLPENIAAVKDDDDYVQTFLYDRVVTLTSLPVASGVSTGRAACITRWAPEVAAPSILNCQVEIEYNSDAKEYINESSNPYVSIFVKIQDHTTNYFTNDGVVLEVYKGAAQPNIPVDPVNIEATTFIPHTFDNIYDGFPSTYLDSIPVQDIVGATRFYIDWNERPNLRLQNISQKLVIKNSVTGFEVEVGNYDLPVTGYPLKDSRAPLVDATIERGFKIPLNEIRNHVRLFNDGTVGDVEYYQFIMPFFVKWEEYRQIILNNVPSDLLDATKPFNGINNFVHRYDTIANYDVFYRITFESVEGDNNFEQSFDYQLNTNDYEAHPNVISRSIKTYTNDGITELLVDGVNAVDLSQNTLIEARWEMDFTPDLSAITVVFWAEELNNGSPTQIHRISSLNGLFDASWFESDVNDGKALLSLDGDTVVARAYFNKENVSVNNIRCYATLYLPNTPSGVKLTQDGLIKKTQDDYPKLIN